MNGLTLADLQYFLPEFILVTLALAILLTSRKNKSSFLHFYLAMGALLGALVLTTTQLGLNVILNYGTVEINTFSILLKMVFLVLSIITLWGSKDFASSIALGKEYYGLLLFATVGLTVLGSAGDLITLFIAFELTSISPMLCLY